MQPFDYVSGFGQNPMGGLVGAMEAGQRFGMMEQQQAALRAREQMAQQEAAFKLQQQQAASLRQQQIADAMARLQANPNRTFADYEPVIGMLFDEKQQASMRANFEAFNKDRQQQELVFTGQALSSLAGGQPEIAAKLMRERATGLRNRGEESQATALEALARATEINPAGAEVTLAGMLSALPGGDKIIEGVGKARKAPAEVKEATAKADSAAVAAKFAEAKAIRDLALTDAQIRGFSTDEEIKRQNVAIATMNARTAAEGNALKRQELQQRLDELQSKRDSTIREKNADLESARGNIDNMLNTADRVLNTPMGVVRSAAGPISARIPTMTQSTADFEALVETLGSQSFLAQIPNIKGMGNLSNAEGEKLQAALQNFSLKQSPEQLMRNVREAQRLLLKARQNIEARYGAAPSVPDTPAARNAAPRPGTQTPQSVDELVRRYGGGG